MKVLVPVAFEETSFAAFAYASHFVEKIGGEITLLNVIHLSYDSVNPLGAEYLDAVEEGVKTRMDYFINEYHKDKKVELGNATIKTEIRFGVPSYTISSMAQEDKYDMIIMGTRDKHGMFDQLLGSTSSNVISSAPCPVMLVHSNSTYYPISNIAFAYDIKGDVHNALRSYSDLNAQIGAKTDFIHIEYDDAEANTSRKSTMESTLVDELNVGYPFEFKDIVSKNIKDTIIDYCKISDIDLLAMIHRERTFLSSLLQPSLSARVAQEFKLPVLVYQG